MSSASSGAVMSGLNLILPMKSPDDLTAVVQALTAVWDPLVAASDAIGTLHDARFVTLNETTLGFFTTYDGDFTTYIEDFMSSLGPIFDAVFAHVDNPPPTPVQQNPQEFIAWVQAHDLPPIRGFYSAYPNLTVQQIWKDHRVNEALQAVLDTPEFRAALEDPANAALLATPAFQTLLDQAAG